MAGKNTPWRIIDQASDQTRNDNAGNTQVGSLIYFITGQGNAGVVFVPDNQLRLSHIKEVVRERANLIDSIGELTEGVFPE